MNTNHEILTRLRSVTDILCRALQQLLPNLSPSWWQDLVMAKLSFQQQQHAALRVAGCSAIEEVRYAVLETNGQITVIPKVAHSS